MGGVTTGAGTVSVGLVSSAYAVPDKANATPSASEQIRDE
ncbi:hypothetical protein SPWS13_0356 [Shewanella putrefaciens]|nr:hypothetical protein SPWS13_0356 [Shewanella putrefaciens]